MRLQSIARLPALQSVPKAGNDTDVETDTETALPEIREQNEMRSEQVHATKRRIGNYDSV